MTLTFIATCDLVALTRGRSVPGGSARRHERAGVGWVPADLALTTFGAIADPNPFGSLGDLRLVPDGAAVTLEPPATGGDATELRLASIVEPDGSPWRCCPRTALVDAATELERRFGLRIRASFEHEFTLLGLAAQGSPFSIEAHRAAEPFGSRLVETLGAAGLEPENWLPEYGAAQYEITLAPAEAVVAADRAILLRAIVRDLAVRSGFRATFSPLVDPEGVGNGVHVHWSLRDASDRPLMLDEHGELSGTALAFAAGIVAHAPAVVGWTAPSVISPLRLGPHHWSSAAGFVGRQNREAMIRVCPTPTVGGGDPRERANLEFRACDATANPWLVLATLIRAGMAGLERGDPSPVIDRELESIHAAERARLGIVELPADVEAAMAVCEQDPIASAWFDPDLLATHTAIRRTEAAMLAGIESREQCARYAAVV